MRVTGPFEMSLRQASKALGAGPRAIEKSSPSSGLGRKSQDLNEQGEKLPPPVRIELVCQDETGSHDPFWDTPRLLPTFVTQVMAQLLPERRGVVSVQTAYGSVPRMALVVDRKS